MGRSFERLAADMPESASKKFSDVKFMFDDSCGISEANFERIVFKYDSPRSFTGDGVSKYAVKLKNVDTEALDKEFWIKNISDESLIRSALDFLALWEELERGPKIEWKNPDIYIAPLYIKTMQDDGQVYIASFLIYDAKNEMLIYVFAKV
jgi:hypothetical protein